GASEQPDIAAVVLERSPLFLDADLVDHVGSGEGPVQAAIARRHSVPRVVSAAIAEVGSAEACLTLIENASAEIATFSLDRIVDRHGRLAAIREALLARDDLPVGTRPAPLVGLCEAPPRFVPGRAG